LLKYAANRFCIFEKTDVMRLITDRKKQVSKRKIPESFIYEILDRKPLYYKGYKEAIRNHQTAESIMGASSLQVFIITYILRILYKICTYGVGYLDLGCHCLQNYIRVNLKQYNSACF